jgi:MFS family permease
VLRLRETLSAVVLAVRNRNMRRAQVAWGTSIVAEWAHFVALGVFAYRSGGTSAVGLAGLVRLLPAAVVAPVASSFADRFRRERFFLVVLLIDGGALVGSAAAAVARIPSLVYAFAAVVGLSSTLVRPTLQALLPSLARTPEELIASNGATSTVESLGALIGPLAAGLVVALAPVGVVFAAAAAVVVLGAVELAGVRIDGPLVEIARAERTNAFRKSWLAFVAIAHLPGPRLVLGLMVVQTFIRGCLNVLVVVAAFRVLHAGDGSVGYMTAAIGVGGLAGALRAMTLRGNRLASPFALSLICWGVPIALIAPNPTLILALALLAIVGFANSVEDVAGFTLLQRAISDEALNGVLGVFWGVAMGAVALGSFAAPALVSAIGPRLAFLCVGSFLPLVTFAAYRSIRRLDVMTAPDDRLTAIDRVSIFAPLSLAAKERLAGKLIPISVAAGTSVIRAGEVGDHFYLVKSGDLNVEVDARTKPIGGGDSFGEVALLRDIPRTATVMALSDSELFALQRADFLTAVTGHPAAARVARAVVDAHLGVAAPGKPARSAR